MRAMRKWWMLACLVLLGCQGRPIASTQTANPEYAIDFLFEHEGCRIYRFFDGHYVYFTNCGGTTSQYKSGKVTVQQQMLGAQ